MSNDQNHTSSDIVRLERRIEELSAQIEKLTESQIEVADVGSAFFSFSLALANSLKEDGDDAEAFLALLSENLKSWILQTDKTIAADALRATAAMLDESSPLD